MSWDETRPAGEGKGLMAEKPTYEELEQRGKELEPGAVASKYGDTIW